MSLDKRISQIPLQMLWAGLSVYRMVDSSFHTFFWIWDRLIQAYTALFCRNYYIFFEGDVHPYPFYNTSYSASGSAYPEMMYWADGKTFLPWDPQNASALISSSRASCLPMLSLEIVNSADRVIYDLSDFVESVRFIETEEYSGPTIHHVLAAWSLSSGIVVDYRMYTIRYIDGNGDTQVWGVPESRSVEAEQPSVETDSVALSEDSSESKEADTPTVAEAPVEPVVAETPAPPAE